MTSGGGIWDVLGIAPTNDRRAIRGAYAARLKAIDVEADPKAFIELREAMERALMTANDPVDGVEASWEVESPAVDAVERDAEHALDGETRQIVRMLYDGYHPGETDESLVQCLYRIWANPAVQHIEMSGRIEDWLATIIADRLPMADPLIEPAVARYGWDRYEGASELGAELSAIFGRRRDLVALAKFADPDRPGSRLFRMLEQDPADVARVEKRRAEPELRAVLRAIRDRYPTIEWHFGEERLRAWVDDLQAPRNGPFSIGTSLPPPVYQDAEMGSGKSSGGTSGWLIAGAVLLTALFRLFSSAMQG